MDEASLRRVSRHGGDGRYRFYDYDELYRLTREQHWNPHGANFLWHKYDYDPAGNREYKLYDGEQSGDQYDYAYDALNQLTTVSATGTPGDRTDVTGTVTDDNLSAVTVFNTTIGPEAEFEAQLRKSLFIARAVDLAVGDNELYALAEDKAGHEARYPQNPSEYHTVTLDEPPAPPLEHVYDHGNASRC